MSASTGNKALSRKRRSAVVENDAYADFVKRVIRAYSRRVGEGDIEAITALVNLSADIDQAITDAMNGLQTWGYSWTDIALRLNMSRQGARQRWGGDKS